MLFLVAIELAYLPSLCEFIEAHVEVVSGKVLLHLTRFFLSEHTPLRQVLVGYRLRYVGCRRIELRPYRPPRASYWRSSSLRSPSWLRMASSDCKRRSDNVSVSKVGLIAKV